MLQIAGCGLLEPVPQDDPDHNDLDARGLIKIFEPPNPRATYSMGIDVSNGLTNWTRELRTDADLRTDNGAIEIIRRGTNNRPDEQVAEFAAPIEPEDLAGVANFLGRLYCGNSEDQQCPCIIEIYPGPGLRTQREMINKYHYHNMFVWRQNDSLVSKPTGSIGWTSTAKSVRDLWGRTARHIKHHKVIINSPWLIEEMANISMRPDGLWGESVGKKHDDRLRAFMLAIWQLHDWNSLPDFDDQKGIEQHKRPNWQASAINYDEMMAEWEDAWSDLVDDYD